MRNTLMAAAVALASCATTVSEEALRAIRDALPAVAPATPQKPRRLLLYTRTLGWRHGSIPAGAAAVALLGEKTGAYTAVHSEDPAMFDEERLRTFDAVLFLNTTGDCLASGALFPSEEEKAALERRKANLLRFVAEGKGFAGIHAATDTFYGWKEYGDMVGAYFTWHPWQSAPVRVEDPTHPLTAMFDPNGFVENDEIYMFGPRSRSSLDGYQPYARERLRVLLSIDTARFGRKGERPDEDYALAWIRTHGKGRVFYSAFGHDAAAYARTPLLLHFLAGLQYALGDLDADAPPTAAR